MGEMPRVWWSWWHNEFVWETDEGLKCVDVNEEGRDTAYLPTKSQELKIDE